MPPARGRRSKDAATGESDFVVVANRLPIDMERLPDGSTTWKRSPGGLVTALEPLLRRRQGAWVGWPGIVDADEDPIEAEDLRLHPVRLSADDVAEYYEGFSNATLWPLYHDVIVKPIYDREWWDRYVDVNRRFAEAASRAADKGATVWVQDYQLQLVPKMLRELRPDLTIGFFLHIPFPPGRAVHADSVAHRNRRRAARCGPGGIPSGRRRAELPDPVATPASARTPPAVRSACGRDSVRCEVDGPAPFGWAPSPSPSTPASSTTAARDRNVRRRAREIRAELGNPRKVLLGVDRLDYTKGIDVRLKAFAELLAEGRVKRDDTVLVQLATPSRERVESYQLLRSDIERQVGHINGEYAEVGHPVVHYLHRPVPRDELIAYFVASDVMLVTPLRDGMNLVAKEYVACRSDLGGALVLSEFTGAAAELRQAYLVNPHDHEGVKDAIEAALNQSVDEGRRRMRVAATPGARPRRGPLGPVVSRRT